MIQDLKEEKFGTTLSNIMINETKISDIKFNCITDYLILVIFALKHLKKTKTELSKLINDYIKLTDELMTQVPRNVYDQIILTNDKNKLNTLKKFI